MKNVLICATVATVLFIAFMFSLAALSIWTKSATPDCLPACATEDSDNCYWDGSRSGNGEGASFVVIDGEVIYLVPSKGR